METDFSNIKNIILIRQQRDELLKASDKYLISDYPITSDNLILIKEYRQKLRDYMDLPEVINSSNVALPDFPQFPI